MFCIFPQKLTQESNFVTNLTRRKSFSLLATKAKFTGLNRALGIARGGEKICEAKYLEYKKKAVHTVYSSVYVVIAQTKPFQPNPLKHNCLLHFSQVCCIL